MSRKEELQQLIANLNKEIHDLSNLCLQLGNKNPQDNFMVKDRLELLKKYRKELKECD